MVTASISLRDVGRTFGATRALAGVDRRHRRVALAQAGRQPGLA